MNMMLLTRVQTAPGLCTRRALTTWKTPTTPSVLHLSMVVAMAQNIPESGHEETQGEVTPGTHCVTAHTHTRSVKTTVSNTKMNLQ